MSAGPHAPPAEGPDPLRIVEELASGSAWLVGGAVRDQLLGRPTTDFDISVTGDPRTLAKALARRLGAHAFELSEGFGGWRVVAGDRSWQVDLLPLTGGSIEGDLSERDLTVNAIARALGSPALIDPFDGSADLEHRRLRMVSADAFRADPLRALRVVRLHCELGFEPDAATTAAVRAAAPELRRVAVERVFAELRRIVISARAIAGLELMDRLALTDVVLPELSALRGVIQSEYHHLDVSGHTRCVLERVIALSADPAALFPDHGELIAEVLAEPLGAELTRGQALRFGALLHDIAKPQTRGEGAGGRVTFIGHDRAGADQAAAIVRRLRGGERLAVHVAELARHHLRLGFLVHEAPLSRDAVYAYLSACEPVELDVTLLSVADRLATRGRKADIAIAGHLELARTMVADALNWRVSRPRPPIRGDELAQALDLEAGPELGVLLARLERESYAGRLKGRDQAIARARELVAERPREPAARPPRDEPR